MQRSKRDAADTLAATVAKNWGTITDVFRKATGSRDKAAFAQLARANAEYKAAVAGEDDSDQRPESVTER